MPDVIVVGAGPAGSRTAARLAADGHQVLVLEKHPRAGVDVCCTGIIGAECFRAYAFPESVVRHAARSARLISPRGDVIPISRDSVQAYVIDRGEADAYLAFRAAAAGAEFSYDTTVTDILIDDDGATVKCAGGAAYHSRAVVLASGNGRNLTARLGLWRCADAVMGVQVEAPVQDLAEVEVYFGRSRAPGFFAWLVPLEAGRARIGLIARRDVGRHLADFMAYISNEGRLAGEATPPHYGGIPIRPLKRTYAPRLLAVGDAAGQVKPLSGGGVYYALLAADIAADTLDQALRRDDLSAASMAAYQRAWQHLLKREIDRGYTARRLFEHLSDGQINRIFAIIKDSGTAGRLAAMPALSFDWHAAAVRALVGAQLSPGRVCRLLRAVLPGG